MRKLVGINGVVHKNVKKESKRLGMDMVDYVSMCCERFSTHNIDPRGDLTLKDIQGSIKELRDVFVSFMRKQESTYHEVNKSNIEKLGLMLNDMYFEHQVQKAKKQKL